MGAPLPKTTLGEPCARGPRAARPPAPGLDNTLDAAPKEPAPMPDTTAPTPPFARTLLRWLRWPAALLLLTAAAMCVYWFPPGPPGVLVTIPQAMAACAVVVCTVVATLVVAWE